MTLDSSSGRERVTTLLATAAIGVYLLIVIGATTALTNAAEACSTWPACGTDLGNAQVLIAWGHRIAALVVGVVVLAAVVAAWRSEIPGRAKAALAVPLIGYPIQIGIGGLAATTTLGWVTNVHLLFGMAIFVALVAALAWTLETIPERSASAAVHDRRRTTATPTTPEPAASSRRAGRLSRAKRWRGRTSSS